MTNFDQLYINSFFSIPKKKIYITTIDDKIDRVLFQSNELLKEC